MKMLITSQGSNPQSMFDTKFGRAKWFCIYDTDNDLTEFVENVNKELHGGAGIKAAELMAELGINKAISGDFGPKAKNLLEKFKIQMIKMDENNSTIQGIIDKLKTLN